MPMSKHSIFLFLSVLILACACNKEQTVGVVEEATSVSNPYKLSLDDALASLGGFLSGDAATKAGLSGKVPGKIDYLRSNDVATKSATVSLPDTLLYLVNFDDSEGYALLSADKRVTPVLAVVEEGTVSLEDFLFADTVEVYRDATYKKAGKNYWIFRYITYDKAKQ